MRKVESSWLDLPGVRLVTISRCVQDGKKVLASFKGGNTDDSIATGFPVPFNPTSLAGYVALCACSCQPQCAGPEVDLQS